MNLMNKGDKYKIVMAGDSSVGKTSLIQRFYENTFDEDASPTVSPGLFRAKVQLPEKEVLVNIWDTAGQEKFKCMTPIYSRNANGIILVFDLACPESFEGVQNWYTFLSKDCITGCQFILCGNKDDLPTEFAVLQADEWARAHEMPFVKVSAKSNFGVKELFQMITQMIIDAKPDFQSESPVVQEILASPTPSKETQKSNCC